MFAAIKAAFGVKDWPEFTREEIAKHNTPESLWLVADDKVYDATSFVYAHPGGHVAILKRGGGCADCREDYKFHSKGARDSWKSLQIGVLSAAAKRAPIPANAAPDPAMLQRATPALRYGRFVANPDGALQNSFADKPAAVVDEGPIVPISFAGPSQSTTDVDAAAGDTDGGEDMMAAGRCCRANGPGECCRTCPRAPQAMRRRADSDPSEAVYALRR